VARLGDAKMGKKDEAEKPRFDDEETMEESEERWTIEDEEKEKLEREIEPYVASEVEKRIREEIKKGLHEKKIRQIMEDLRRAGYSTDEKKLRERAILDLIEGAIDDAVLEDVSEKVTTEMESRLV